MKNIRQEIKDKEQEIKEAKREIREKEFLSQQKVKKSFDDFKLQESKEMASYIGELFIKKNYHFKEEGSKFFSFKKLNLLVERLPMKKKRHLYFFEELMLVGGNTKVAEKHGLKTSQARYLIDCGESLLLKLLYRLYREFKNQNH